jgi:tripartite-type tricarboxylate transporter receptor subunit TctC
MKKILLTILTTLFLVMSASVSFAADKIDVLQHSRAGGLGDRMVTYIADALGDKFGEKIVVDNCAAAIAYLKKAKNPVVTALPFESMAKQNDGSKNACAIPKKYFINMYAASPWSVCHRTDNASATIDALRNGEVRVGVWQNGFYGPRFIAFMKAINPNAKVIPYKKAKMYRAALVAGEIDFSISTVAKDGESCPVVLNDKIVGDAEMIAQDLEPKAPHSVLGYSYFFAGKNVKGIDIPAIVFASESWKNRRDHRYGQFMIDESRNKQWKVISK